MAEGLLRGLVGKEGEEPRSEGAPETPVSVDAFAAAVAAIASRQDPEVARRTADFLSGQLHLAEVQAKHLEDEHELRLRHLRNQLREEGVRRFGLRLRVGFQLFLALVATVIGVGGAVMLRDAFSSRSVVVESFDAPLALAARGVTGKVIAGGVLDELNRLQAATKSSAAKRNLSNAWASEVKLAVPDTGISVGEISRLLNARFGHDLHIDGDLVETPTGGLALTVRGDGVQSKTFTGAAGELNKLTTVAAEYVYAESQPALWATYLGNTGRNEDAIAFCRAAFARADKTDRPYLLNTWGIALQNTGGSPGEALTLYRAALKIKPDFWVASNNVMNALWGLGDEEGAWRAGEDMRKAAGGRPGGAPEQYYQNWDVLTWNLSAWLDAATTDADLNAGLGTGATSAGPQIADIEARLHDPASAELALQTTKADATDPTIAAITHFVRGQLAAEGGDVLRAATEMEAFATAYADPAVSSNVPGYNCWVGPAEEAAGHAGKADAALEAGGHFVDCYRFRGDVLDHRGDWPGAQKAYAAAVEIAPDLPAGYYSWGVALARHGDLTGAGLKLKEANRRGPHWADPLKSWGDVLAKQGHGKEALMKYDEALKYAPDWAALKQAREAVAKQRT